MRKVPSAVINSVLQLLSYKQVTSYNMFYVVAPVALGRMSLFSGFPLVPVVIRERFGSGRLVLRARYLG